MAERRSGRVAETAELRRLRRKIDALDRRIVALLNERARLARDAAAMYAELESSELHRKVTKLEGELEAARAEQQEERSVHGDL